LRGLNEINHKYPTPENKPRLDYIYENVNICDSIINSHQPDLDDLTQSINDILADEHSSEYDELEYYKTVYFLKGRVNQKFLNDTVIIYINEDMESTVSFTNVLYTDETN